MMSKMQKDFENKSRLRELFSRQAEPEMLGSGAARNAAELLKKRGEQIDEAVDTATQAAGQEAAQTEAEVESKQRSPLRFADGGSVGSGILSWLGSGAARRAGEQLSGRGQQIDRIVDTASNGQQPTPQPSPGPQQSPAPAPDSQPSSAGSSPVRLPPDFRFADGGRVRGPGGPTDDRVGPVMLSDREYVLPADTADAIGRDLLDQIRLETHEFKDGKKESALRKHQGAADELADGGSPFDPRKHMTPQVPGLMNANPTPSMHASSMTNSMSAAPTSMPRPTKGVAGANAAPAPARSGVQNLAKDVEMKAKFAPHAAPAAPAASPLRGGGTIQPADTPLGRAAHGAGKFAGKAARLAGPIAGAAFTGTAVAEEMGQDRKSGYMDQFRDSLNLPDNALGRAVAHGARALQGIGDNLTFGAAGRAGQAASGLVSGGLNGAVEGATAPTHREQFYNAKGRTPTPTDPFKRAAAPVEAAPAAAPQPDQPAVQQAAVTPKQNSFSNAGSPEAEAVHAEPDVLSRLPKVNAPMERVRDRQAAIAREYDALIKAGQGKNVRNGLDWAQRHGLDVMNAKFNAMHAAGGETTADMQRNTSMQLAADKENAANAQRLLDNMASRESQLRGQQMRDDAALRRDQLRAKIAEMGHARSEADRAMKTVDAAFPNQPEEAQRLREFIANSNLKWDGKSLSQLSPDDQVDAVADAKSRMQMRDRINAQHMRDDRGLIGTDATVGNVDIGDLTYDPAGLELADMWNYGKGPLDLLSSNLGLSEKRAVFRDSAGVPHDMETLVYNNGVRDELAYNRLAKMMKRGD